MLENRDSVFCLPILLALARSTTRLELKKKTMEKKREKQFSRLLDMQLLQVCELCVWDFEIFRI